MGSCHKITYGRLIFNMFEVALLVFRILYLSIQVFKTLNCRDLIELVQTRKNHPKRSSI